MMASEFIIGCALNHQQGRAVFRQGATITRLLGRLTMVDGAQMYPKDPLKGLLIDCLMEEARDVRCQVMPCLTGMRDESRTDEFMSKLTNEVLPFVIG